MSEPMVYRGTVYTVLSCLLQQMGVESRGPKLLRNQRV